MSQVKLFTWNEEKEKLIEPFSDLANQYWSYYKFKQLIQRIIIKHQ